MLTCKFCLFSLVGILCICFCVGNSSMKNCTETDRQALLNLKDGFIDASGILLSSWKGDNCCKWKGISCDDSTGRVTGLELPFSYYSPVLGGKISSSICELQHLTSLDLSFNYLEGSIPNCIGSLRQLTELKLGTNELDGSIPQTLANLSNLQTLDLGYNYLFANDLKWVSHLSNLRSLSLMEIDLSRADDWLSSISKIPSLLELHLDGCGLSQINSKSVPHMNSSTSLKILGLSGNNFNSSILPWVLNVSKVLTNLDLSSNSLQHSIPDVFANMISLQYLGLSDNELDNSILKSFRSLCQLKKLWLDSNKLSGQLNDCIKQLCSAQNGLELLDLSHNPFTSAPLPDFSWLSSLNSLFLEDTNIVGPLPQSFGHLFGLESLDLSFNQLSGSLPLFDVSKLASIESLDLSHNQLNGTLPYTMWQLTSLRFLSLSSNMFSGDINEAHLSKLPNLTNLDLSFNQLSGSLPSFEVSKFPLLEDLDLSHNELSETLPYSIGQLSSLKRLSVSSNKLNGVINETHLSNLSSLINLNVAKNSLSFNLSSNWVPPFQLLGLYATSCNLGPKFPTWLRHQRVLIYLQISNASISDSFPEWFWDLSSSFSYLNVSHNNLRGALPESFSSMKTIYPIFWDFSFNNLSGSVPIFPELYGLFLSNNMLSGSISSFCAMSPLYLTYLDLSSNLLTGPLSDCLGKFQNLVVLNLAKNTFSGRIPKSFGNLRRIETMHLNNNNFSGEIPSLSLCSSLTFIDFGDNNFQGILPAWIGHDLHHLIVLRLRANKFQGNIPPSLCNLMFLQVLDLSKNNITGEIPQCLGRIIALSNMKFPRKPIFFIASEVTYVDKEVGLFVDEAALAWKGENREYGKILGLMTTIDLSCNYLTGEIPQSITTLVALAGLNLSVNNLTGFIPSNIGHMEMLESLDLSRNHLYGRMPSSFSNLTFLSYMNLSFNNLSGKIPISTQLQSFDASAYYGNSGLCGPPLTYQCPWDAVAPTRSTHKNDTDEDELITIGFYISLGLGFFVGFWGVCGTLAIKNSWRHAYFQFFNKMNEWMCMSAVVLTTRMKKKFQV